jgi:DnaK suppressor protein
MDDDQARRLLLQHRERMQSDLERLRRDDDDGEHLADDELEAGVAEQLREELAAIDRAEERLARGTYGLSIESGDPIPDARLELVPWAERTVEEESRLAR